MWPDLVAEPREGVIRYLKAPKVVLALVMQGDAVTGTILMARAGCVIFGLEIDVEAAGISEVRAIDIGTLMTQPFDYVKAITKGSICVRDTWDSEVRQVDLDDAVRTWGPTLGNATITIYETFARTSRRHKIEQGAFVYYLGMLYPFMREMGLYEHYDETKNLWEFDPRTTPVYYLLDDDNFARVTVPTKLFDPKDSAFALVPEREP